MSISEIKSTARKTLSGKLVNAYIIAGLYTLICFTINFISKNILNDTNILMITIKLILNVVQIAFGFGMISNLIKLSKQHETIPYTNFISDAVLNFTKVFKLLFGIFIRMLIPIILLSLGLSATMYVYNLLLTNLNLAPLLLVMSILLIIGGICFISYSLNYVLAIFSLVDNPDKLTKEHLTTSKNIIKGNKLNYILLFLSFIIYYVIIGLILYIAQFFVDPLIVSVISSVLVMLLQPYITISQYIFYEELLPVETENK